MAKQVSTELKVVLLVAVLAVTSAAWADGKKAAPDEKKGNDIDKLYDLVQEARTELQALRVQAGLSKTSGEKHRKHRGEHGEHREGHRERRGEHRDGRGEHDGKRGEHREGRGEHDGRRGEHGGRFGESGEGEESGKRMSKLDTWNATRNGAHLILAYNAATQSFQGTVQNKTKKVLSEVRVEVHLSNGVELGPTKRINLKPDEKVKVELAAADQKFAWWTTHPEHGNEENHGPGHEKEHGEHGEGGEFRPSDPDLRPLFNELLLLNHEIKMLQKDLKNKRR